MRIYFILSLFLLISVTSIAQECSYTLSGYLVDEDSNTPLEYAGIIISETQQGVHSDSTGYFEITNVCAGNYQIEFSHIGCECLNQQLQIKRDTVVTFYLHHHAELLEEVVVRTNRADLSTQTSTSISEGDISKESNKNLSDLLENITGVSTLKNGSGISKPVIHGLYGNRIAILNNGIAQAGQQWGNDHAPEIDPASAQYISVIKGANALAYSSNSLGSIVVVDGGSITDNTNLQANLNYIYQTNGRGHTFNTRLEQNGKWAAWRYVGTLKKIGDTHTPNHFLTNTGKGEANISFQIEKKFSTQWHNKFYYSLFNTEIGVLRGSHIGNLTDLETALARSRPFFTQDEFSYTLNPPRQEVKHHLLKFESKYFINDLQSFRFQYGGQLNNRKEFDIRRGGRSEIPAMSLNQFSHFLEGNYNLQTLNNWQLKTGLQFRTVDNANEPGTGIIPLIPRFNSYTPSVFGILQKQNNQWLFEVGGRYDYRFFWVKIQEGTSSNIVRYDHQFHNYAFSTGAKYRDSSNLKASFNLGYMQRAPEVNELYASGLHQGVSGIEEGDRNLQQEKSLKAIGSIDWNIQENTLLQATAYYHYIDDYIYLQPQDDFRLTIRGAFPVFIYEQTDAALYGADLQLTYELIPNLELVTKYAIVRGKDRVNNNAIINLPSDNLFTSLEWRLPSSDRFNDTYISINGRYVWQQDRITAEQDFVAPPEAYYLMGLQMGTSLPFGTSKVDVSLTVDNLFNVQYRDYLNRLRYFADEMGRNVSLRVNYQLGH